MRPASGGTAVDSRAAVGSAGEEPGRPPPAGAAAGGPSAAAREGRAGLDRGLVLALFLGAGAAAWLTVRDFGIASDVANYFQSSLRQISWARKLLAAIGSGGAGELLGREQVLEHWRWLPERVPHPPLSRELSGLSFLALRRWLDPLTAYRGAALLTYAALVASLAAATRRFGGTRLAALAAAAAALTVPALFAHAHFAHTDLFLAAFWFWCAMAVERYRRSPDDRHLVTAGLLLGAACATKFSGVLLVPATGAWLLLHRRLDLRATTVLTAAALLVFLAADPALWVDPVGGVREYVAAGLGRSEREVTRISTEYFGRVYSFRAPWHYPLVWTAIVLPLPILAVVLAGTSRWGAPLVRLALLNAALLYGALMLPAAPLHDGIRLFLPVFPFLCLLAGVGCEAAASALRRLRLPPRASGDLVAALVFFAVFSLPLLRTVQYHPHQLSYFNALVGGIRGAAARGLEVTNLKEALSPSVVADLSGRIPEGSIVHGGFLTEELCFYRAVGEAPSGWRIETALNLPDGSVRTITCEGTHSLSAVARLRPPREPEFVFVLNRRAQLGALELALMEFGGAPFYELAVEGVALLRVYRTE